MSGVQQIEVSDADDGVRLDRWFKDRFPALGFGKLQKLLRTGQVRVDGGRAKPGQRLETGQIIRIPPLGDHEATPKPKPQPQKVDKRDAADLHAMVLHKSKDVLVINKPPGLAVQGGTNQQKHLDGMLDALKFDAEERPRLVHRLDRDTSGVLLLARHQKAARWLTEAFRDKTARKLYWALVIGVPDHPEGRIDLRLDKQGGKGHEKMRASDDGKRAMTDYQIIERLGRRAAWLAMEPLTGRTHQLRAHAAAMGTPIAGDGKYGGREATLDGDVLAKGLHLHARRLAVRLPNGQDLDVIAPPPAHMQESWRRLGLLSDSTADAFLDPIG